jgi:hypothetical protein
MNPQSESIIARVTSTHGQYVYDRNITVEDKWNITLTITGDLVDIKVILISFCLSLQVRSKSETYGAQIVVPFSLPALLGIKFSERSWAPRDEAMVNIIQCISTTILCS